MGPDLMAEMRAQAEKFGAEIIQGNVTRVDLCSQPIVVKTPEAEYHGEDAHHRDRRVGAAARPAVGADADGPRRVDLRDLRRLLLPRPGDRGRRRRRLGDGRSGVPHAVRDEGHGGAPARARCARRRSCRTRRARTRRSRGCSTPRSRRFRDGGKGEVTAMVVRNNKTGESHRDPGDRRVRRHRPHAEHVAVPRAARARSPTATSSRTTARRRASPASSPAATSRITSTARRSPPPAPAAWPRSTPNTTSTTFRSISRRSKVTKLVRRQDQDIGLRAR